MNNIPSSSASAIAKIEKKTFIKEFLIELKRKINSFLADFFAPQTDPLEEAYEFAQKYLEEDEEDRYAYEKKILYLICPNCNVKYSILNIANNMRINCRCGNTIWLTWNKND